MDEELKMNSTEIKDIFNKHSGVMKTRELYDAGVLKHELKKLTDTGILERITKGYYKLFDEEISDIKLISILIPEGVLCFDTALFYYEYSDRTPMEWHIAVYKDISKAKVRLDYPYIKPYFIERKILNMGVEEVTIEDVRVKIYSRDRLICDCLKYENKMDVELFNKAIQAYINDPKKNISKLMEFAKARGVTKKVYDKIGTWL
jgi:predicted transcriptional regulator of viral defense system